MSLRWIIEDEQHHLLPLGSKAGHLHLTKQDETWTVEHACNVWGTALLGRTTLTSGLVFDRARQFAEAYAQPILDWAGLREVDALWRSEPATLRQKANLLKVGVDPVALAALAMTMGEASDAYQRLKAEQTRAKSIEL